MSTSPACIQPVCPFGTSGGFAGPSDASTSSSSMPFGFTQFRKNGNVRS
jgi:hypothetical protein